MHMNPARWIVLVAAVTAGCGGGGGGGVTAPTPTSGTTPSVSTLPGPPAGASQWNFEYRQAITHTCPSTPQTPDDGGIVTMTLAADARTMTVVGLTPNIISIGTLTTDSTGGWTAQKPGLIAGSVVSITFRFSTSRLADGLTIADRAIFTGGVPCSATWPIVLTRQ